VIVRWTASDETGWVADLDSAAVTVWKLQDSERLEGVELRHLMVDLYVLLAATAGRLEVVLAERRWLRDRVRTDLP
jgi:hypothetical protein